MRACFAAALGLAILALPMPGDAQEQATPAPEAAPEVTPEATPEPAPAPEGEGSAPVEGEATPPERPRFPPVVVIPIALGRTPAEAAAAIRDVVAGQLRPLVERREVLVLSDEATVAAAAACTDAACVGAIVAAQGAISGVLIRMDRRRNRDPITVMLGVVDPVSGASRGEPVQGEVPRDQLEDPTEALGPVTAQLAPLMPPAPRTTTLLVASNVDEATVTIDEQEVGTTPLPPGNITPGEHTVAVSRPGYLVQSHRVEIAAGQAMRLNFDLEPTPQTAAGDGTDLQAGFGGEDLGTGGGGGDGGGDSILSKWWFWTAIGGVVVVGVLIGIIAAAASGGPEQQEAVAVPPIMR